MKNIPEILNVSERKLGQAYHDGQVVFSAERLCLCLGFAEAKAPTFSLKDEEIIVHDGPNGVEDHVTVSGAIKLIMMGPNSTAATGRDYLCEEILSNL